MMSSKYKIRDQSLPYFLTYATVGWVDVFTRANYRDIILESLDHCHTTKGLQIHGWCIMSNHVHLIASTTDKPLETIMRDHKRHTAELIHQTIKQPGESRKEWMLAIFTKAGTMNTHNHGFQLWQQDYHPVALESYEMLLQRLNYTHLNPVRAGLVDAPQDWRYSSAVAYAGGHSILKCLKMLEE